MTEPVDYGFWQDLISFKPSQSATQALGWREYIQPIEAAKGERASLDFYPIRLSALPKIGNHQLSPEELLNYVRLNINDFVDNKWAEFHRPKWRSPNPIGSSIHITMKDPQGLFKAPDRGTVILTSRTPRDIVFSTANTWRDSDHPVSGHRQFGYVPLSDGTSLWYTRGADRPTGRGDNKLSGLVYGAQDELWRSFQEKLQLWVNQHGGSAKAQAPTVLHPQWDQVKSLFRPTNAVPNGPNLSGPTFKILTKPFPSKAPPAKSTGSKLGQSTSKAGPGQLAATPRKATSAKNSQGKSAQDPKAAKQKSVRGLKVAVTAKKSNPQPKGPRKAGGFFSSIKLGTRRLHLKAEFKASTKSAASPDKKMKLRKPALTIKKAASATSKRRLVPKLKLRSAAKFTAAHRSTAQQMQARTRRMAARRAPAFRAPVSRPKPVRRIAAARAQPFRARR
jgi:hypothetical protein